MTTYKSSASVAQVQLDSLQIGKRHRSIDKFKVASLAKSMGAIGLQQPISVHAGADGAMYLIAGLHRVKAAMSLGWDHIDGIVVELDEVDRELWEIDENLQRAGLSKAEEREHFKRRKELWEKRQSTHHAPIESKRADGKGHRPKGFAAETAAATGLSKSQINRKLAKSKPAVKRAAKAATEKTAKERLDDVFDVGADGDDLAIPSFLDRKATAEQPAPKETARAPLSRKPTKLETQHIGVIKARRLHVDEAVNVGVDIETEIELFADELRRAARNRAGNGAADIGAERKSF